MTIQFIPRRRRGIIGTTAMHVQPGGCRDPAAARRDKLNMTERSRALILVALAELLGMSLWFTASAVAPRIAAEWHLAEGTASWLTLAVQIGRASCRERV